MNCAKILLTACNVSFIIMLNAQGSTWTLKACIDTAIKRNIALNQGQLTSEQNRINLKQSKDNLYPNLNISDVQNFNFGRSLDPFTYQFTNQSISINNAALTSSVNLFNGFLYANTIKENRFNYQASVKNVEKLKNDLTLNILGAYMQVLVGYEGEEIAKAQMESTKGQVDRTQKYVEAGKVAETNLLQIESQLATDQFGLVHAENILRIAKVNLMQLMNLPIVDDFDVQRPTSTDINQTSLTRSEIYKTAEGFFPEIQGAKLSISASEAGYKIAKALYYPKLTFNAGLRAGYSSAAANIYTSTVYQQQVVGYVQNNPSDVVVGFIPTTTLNRTGYPAWNQFIDRANEFLGFNLSIPVFNNFLARNNTALAKVNIMNAQLNEKSVKAQLRINIEQAYTDMIAAKQELNASLKALKFEERTYKDFEKKYTFGLISATDFLIEKSNYTKAEQTYAQLKYQYLFKTKVVDFYLGKSILIE